METTSKIKDWIRENAPMFSAVYENKYVGMVYDRFGSLPPKQQKQILIGAFCGAIAIVIGFLFLSYLSLWSSRSKAEKAYSGINLLLQYQRQLRDKSSQIQQLERNAQLASPGQLKQHLVDQAKNASISPRIIEVEEKPEASGQGDEKTGSDIRMKQASVVLQRVNLSQLKTFLSFVELGQYNLSISSLKITNDDKIRGYMKVELGIVAYLFPMVEGG